MNLWSLHATFLNSLSQVYAGSVTLPSIQALINQADLVIDVGPLKSDFNTGSFSYSIKSAQTVELHISHALVGYADYPQVPLRSILPRLKEAFVAYPKVASVNVKAARTHAAAQRRLSNVLPKDRDAALEAISQVEATVVETEKIVHAYLWPRLSTFFRDGDVIIGETGTSSFGILDTTLPKNVSLLLQVLWGSIGWSVGATLGAALAAREEGRRTILFVGDGSLQLTVQEVRLQSLK